MDQIVPLQAVPKIKWAEFVSKDYLDFEKSLKHLHISQWPTRIYCAPDMNRELMIRLPVGRNYTIDQHLQIICMPMLQMKMRAFYVEYPDGSMFTVRNCPW